MKKEKKLSARQLKKLSSFNIENEKVKKEAKKGFIIGAILSIVIIYLLCR